MARRGRPPGSGKWGKLLMQRATDGPLILLVPDGASRQEQRGVNDAVKSLVDAGMLCRVRLWYPSSIAPRRRLRTFIFLPDAQLPDGRLVKDVVHGDFAGTGINTESI